MFDFEHTIAKKYDGTIFGSSLAEAGGSVFATLLPHKPREIKPEDAPGAVIEEGGADPPCCRSFGLHTQRSTGVEGPWPGWVCSLCSSVAASRQVGAAIRGSGWRGKAQFGHRTPSDASQHESCFSVWAKSVLTKMKLV